MISTIIEIVAILLLIVANGVLAMAEIAIISARKARLRHQADRGNKGAHAALHLAENPGEFLSTVQIGITLVGILAGALGGATLTEELRMLIERVPVLVDYSETISFAIVVAFITYLSLVVGELAPKQLGLARPERIAGALARPMQMLSRIAHPAVWLLGVSTNLWLKTFGFKPDKSEAGITEEEIRILVRQGAQSGTVARHEKEIIERAFQLGDRRAATIMTPRPDIDWIDLTLSAEEIRQLILTTAHSRYPVGRGRLNDFAGVVSVRDLFVGQILDSDINIDRALRQPLFIPEVMNGFDVLEQFKKANTQFALVIDEYGTIVGLITLNDILEALVGDLPGQPASQAPSIVRRDDGSWLVDAMISLLDLQDILPVQQLREQGEDYNTLAGFVLARLGRIPGPGDHFEVQGIRIEVLDMDANRIDKVLIVPSKKSLNSAH